MQQFTYKRQIFFDEIKLSICIFFKVAVHIHAVQQYQINNHFKCDSVDIIIRERAKLSVLPSSYNDKYAAIRHAIMILDMPFEHTRKAHK